ncbi:MAG: FHA domain-containing protein, partial [Kofleriaceae bacterium]
MNVGGFVDGHADGTAGTQPMFKLVIQDDEGKTTIVPLIRDEITIGRKEGNTIRLTERNVSRRHARILRNNGEVQIEDLGSYNGIRVNNARIAERVSLRVSDQVQIGDYKLYLKAEGVEQVDDARTMPIERLEHIAPTDVIPAVAPTQPMGIPAAPPAMAPNRTMVAGADTDPQGRPIASAAAVAALTAPLGYGKLVVLSSNFAGREFELSRPQMIIGRTDENDIVINHRSISRNHAKLVREPETGRYTISDLQSSNGVRVNGQDYGKVELRRGDVVDLGHVRLRFVEPGEDFVFARDAVVTDVPETGGKRTMLLVALVGLVVVGGVITFMVAKGGGGGDDKRNPPIASGVDPVAADAALVAVQTPDAAPVVEEIDAGVGTMAKSNDDDKERIRIQCLEAQSAEDWASLRNCADKLRPLNAAEARKFQDKSDGETRSEPRIRGLETALSQGNLKNAKKELEQIWSDSVHYDKMKSKYEQAEKAAIEELVTRLRKVNSGDCKDYNALLKQERESKPPRIAEEARRQVGCKPASSV